MTAVAVVLAAAVVTYTVGATVRWALVAGVPTCRVAPPGSLARLAAMLVMVAAVTAVLAAAVAVTSGVAAVASYVK